MIEIPLQNGVNNAHQRFTQELGGMLVSFEIDYVSYTDSPYWVMTVKRDGYEIACGLPLNAGADLLANHNIQGFGQLVFVGDEATLDNLGVANHLVWIPE